MRCPKLLTKKCEDKKVHFEKLEIAINDETERKSAAEKALLQARSEIVRASTTIKEKEERIAELAAKVIEYSDHVKAAKSRFCA